MTHETLFLFEKERKIFGTKESLASYQVPFEYLLVVVFWQKKLIPKL